jgi:hydroxyacylglutathione hydrolase
MNQETQRIDLGMVNAFLVPAGDGFILIDTGLSQHWAQLESELTRAGCLPERLKLVVATHGDMDHIGNCARLQKKYGARIAMHPGDAAMAETGVPQKRKITSFRMKMFMTLGRLFRKREPFQTFQPDLLLADGQDLRDYGLVARVLHIPGHTKGSIAILTEAGELFAGDTAGINPYAMVFNRTRPVATPIIQDQGELKASLAKLKALNARTIYPGHGKPFPFTELAAVRI